MYNGKLELRFLTEKSLGEAAAIHRKEEEFVLKSEIRFCKYLGSNVGRFKRNLVNLG